MCKSAPRTMRFDGKVEKIINEFRGDNFSEKFHNLVYHFKNTIPQREKRIKDLDKRIKDGEKKLAELNNKISDVEWIVDSMKALKTEICYVYNYIEKCNTKIQAAKEDPSLQEQTVYYNS